MKIVSYNISTKYLNNTLSLITGHERSFSTLELLLPACSRASSVSATMRVDLVAVDVEHDSCLFTFWGLPFSSVSPHFDEEDKLQRDIEEGY